MAMRHEQQRERLVEAVVEPGLEVGGIGQERAEPREGGLQALRQVERQLAVALQLGVGVHQHHCSIGGGVVVVERQPVEPPRRVEGGVRAEDEQQLVEVRAPPGPLPGPEQVRRRAQAVEDEAPVGVPVRVLAPGEGPAEVRRREARGPATRRRAGRWPSGGRPRSARRRRSPARWAAGRRTGRRGCGRSPWRSPTRRGGRCATPARSARARRCARTPCASGTRTAARRPSRTPARRPRATARGPAASRRGAPRRRRRPAPSRRRPARPARA